MNITVILAVYYYLKHILMSDSEELIKSLIYSILNLNNYFTKY